MKKILAVLLVSLLLAASILYAQTTYSIRDRRGASNVNIKAICLTEGDAVWSIAGAAADTSVVYSVPAWDEVWWTVKPSGQAADSIDQVIWLDIESTEFISSAGNTGIGWKSGMDSSKIVTADTLYGVYKKLTFPPSANYFRIRAAGVTGNDASTGSSVEIWVHFKKGETRE